MKRIFTILVLLLLNLSLFSCTKKSNYSDQRPRTIEITAKQFSYTPGVIKVKKGETVNIQMRSLDVVHGFYLDGYNLEFSVVPGEMYTVSFKATKSGRFTFRCSKTCGELHPYMVGYLKVTPNIEFAGGLGILLFIGGIFSILLMKGKFKNRYIGIFSTDFKFELTQYSWVRKILKTRWIPLLLILINLAIFTMIFIAGWSGGIGPGNYNFGIIIVWIVWWLLLMIILVPLFARIWCTVCPMPVLGDWLQRLRIFGVRKGKLFGLNKRWPHYLRNMWLVNFLFLFTTFFIAFITTRPIHTLAILAIIVLGDVIISYFYEKRTFCKYVCPVGGFQGLYANFSPVEIRVKNLDICKDHPQKTCVVGNDKGYGCPWLEVPYKMKRNTYCGLCFECFKSCPYDNMTLNIRSFGSDLLVEKKRGLDESWKSFIMVGLAVIFYVVMQGPWGFFRDWANMKSISGFVTFATIISFVTLILLPAIFGLFVYLSKKFSKIEDTSFRKIYTNLSYALVPLGLSAWIAFSFGVLFANSSYVLHVLSDPYSQGWNLLGTTSFPWTPFMTSYLPYFQIVSIVGGLVFGLDFGFRLSKQTFKKENSSIRGFIPLASFLFLLSLTFLWVYVG